MNHHMVREKPSANNGKVDRMFDHVDICHFRLLPIVDGRDDQSGDVHLKDNTHQVTPSAIVSSCHRDRTCTCLQLLLEV